MELEELEHLAGLAQKGDTGALTRLLQEHKLQLYKMAYRCLGNEADALEALQEVSCRACLQVGKLKEPQHITTWLVRILLNYCHDVLKKRQRRQRLQQTLEPDARRAAEGGGEDEESRRLRNMMVAEAVGQLEERYQTVIQLKYYHDLTLSEIARTLERPEGTVKTWLNKALTKLRTQLDKEENSHG